MATSSPQLKIINFTMRKILTIELQDFAKSTVTRDRGNEAYAALEKMLRENASDTVMIDLRKAELVSLSFLDSIIVNIKKNDNLRNVTFCFMVKNEDVLKKLRKVITMRDFKAYYKASEESEDKEIERVTLNPSVSAEGIESKEELERLTE